MTPNNKPETSADIEAELRELSMSAEFASAKYTEYRLTVYGEPIALYFAKLADRLKAAHKRELFTKTRETDNSETAIYTNDNSGDMAHKREMSKIASKNGADFGHLGDAAELREALKTVKRYLDGYTVNVLEMRSQVDAALAATASDPAAENREAR